MNERELRDLLERKFGQASLVSGGNGPEIVVQCPHCSRRKLSVNARKAVWHCWHCGEAGTLKALLGMDVKVDVSRRAFRPRTLGYIPPGDTVPVGSLPDDHEASCYLAMRKFDRKVLSDVFGISYCRRGRKFGGGIFDTSGCLVIPITDGGRDVAWQARLLYDPDKVPEGHEASYGWLFENGKYKKPPKYFTSPGFKKGERLFNMDQASRFPIVVVTEGAFDAMRVGPCAVAAFGKGVTDIQAELLKRWQVVVLLLDPDAEADQESLRRRIEMRGPFGRLGTGPKVVSVHLSGYKDAGEAPQGEVVRQIMLACSSDGVDLGRVCREDPFLLTARRQQ